MEKIETNLFKNVVGKKRKWQTTTIYGKPRKQKERPTKKNKLGH